jgi:multiple sugar transport system permease protein
MDATATTGTGPVQGRAPLPSRRRARQRRGSITLRNTASGLFFVSPWLLGLLALTIYPLAASAYYSFTEYGIVDAPKWIGLANYRELFTTYHLFRIALGNTLYFAAVDIPLATILAIGLALLLNVKVKGMAFYRTLFYMPSIVPTVASAMLWLWILNPQYGLANEVLRQLGLPTLGWIASPQWSKPSLILMDLWGAGSAVVIYLAGLQDIPENLYEAAELDGAGSLRKTWHVTLPMLTPVIFFNLVMSLIGTFQYFTQAYVMTRGGPLDSTLFYALLIYRNAFFYFKMGFASAMSWILFLIVLVLTLVLFRSSDRWVYYGGAMR